MCYEEGCSQHAQGDPFLWVSRSSGRTGQEVVDQVAAFVPMKGRSERVPGKNIRPLAGRPLYHWIVEALLDVDRVSTIVIDTDSEEIAADVASNFPQVRVVERPEELRGDFVPMHDVLVHDANQVEEEWLLQTHSTNPLLKAATIERALDEFLEGLEGGHDSLFTVTPWQIRLFWPDGSPINHDPSELLRTQDLDPVYEENSCLYLYTREVIERTGQRTGENPIMLRIDRGEAVDIDEEVDFLIADLLMRNRIEG